MSLFRAAKLNAAANYLNFVVVALVTIVVSPILATHLGNISFGTWKAIQKFLDFGTVADGRATQALKWVLAKSRNTATDTENRQAVGSALVVWLMFIPLTAAFGCLLVWSLPWLISNVPASDAPGIRVVGTLLVLNLLLVPLLGIPDAVLVGINRGYVSMMVQTATFVLSNTLMAAVAYAGYGLLALAAMVLMATAANAAIIYLQARRSAPWFGIKKPSRAQVRNFFGFSGWVLLWSLVSKLLLSSDMLLLSFLQGPGAVTNYTFSAYAPQFALAVCFMTGSAAMPGIGSLLSPGNETRAAEAVTRIREVVTFLATVLCGGILLFNGAFVMLWAGQSRYMGGIINILIVLEVFQLILIRNEAQIQDLSLSIKPKVLVGACFSILSWVVGCLLYRMTDATWSIFVGTIIARLALSIAYPRMVNAAVPGLSGNWRLQVLSLMLLIFCGTASLYLCRFPAVPMTVGSIAALLLLMALCYCLLLKRAARQQLHSLIRLRA